VQGGESDLRAGGAWDYWSGVGSKPFITMTQNTLPSERVVSDLHHLAADLEAMLQDRTPSQESRIADLRSRLSRILSQTGETCGDLGCRASNTAKRGLAAADASVRAHPWESAGLAFVVGLVAGVWATRRRSA
jgi:ElaB/YqjD/DUF883 family membrane-anchored ribosome-binding protein